MENTPHLSC